MYLRKTYTKKWVLIHFLTTHTSAEEKKMRKT